MGYQLREIKKMTTATQVKDLKVNDHYLLESGLVMVVVTIDDKVRVRSIKSNSTANGYLRSLSWSSPEYEDLQNRVNVLDLMERDAAYESLRLQALKDKELRMRLLGR